MIPGLRTTLWSHQQRALDFALKRRGSLLGIHMGGGKTAVSVAAALAWNARRVLITCPLSVVGAWPREFERHSAEPWHVERLDRGTVASRAARAAKALKRPGRVAIVISHDASWRPAFRALAQRTAWDLLICDEVHRLKAPGGILSRFHATLARQVPRRLGLSGTPLPHGPLDAYAIARFLDPSVFGTRFAAFRERYAVMLGTEGWQAHKIAKFINMDEFEERLGRILIRIPQAECIELPPETDVERTCELEPAAAKLYEEIENNFCAQVGDGVITAPNALVSLLRLEGLCGGYARTDDGILERVSEAKRKLLADTLEDLPLGEPVVVFARFIADLDAILEVGRASGRRCGELSGRARDGLTDRATMREAVDLLAVQIQAGGVGIDLTRAATAIYYSRGWNLGDLLQSRARLHRPGQSRPVTYINLVVENTIDQVALRALAKREDLVEGVLERIRSRELANV